MNREIIFRGKYYNTNDLWEYSDSKSLSTRKIGLSKFWKLVEDGAIDEETIGQYTGEKDLKGHMIFEDDIVKWFLDYNYIISGHKNEIITANFLVIFEQGAFWIDEINNDDEDKENNRLVRNSCENQYNYPTPICEIIGNKWDNQELLIKKGEINEHRFNT